MSPNVADEVREGEFIASVVDIFGFLCDEYYAPCNAVVVGKSTNPSNLQGLCCATVCPPPASLC